MTVASSQDVRSNLDLASQKYLNIKGKMHPAIPCMYIYRQLDLFDAFQELFHVTSITLHFQKWLSTQWNGSPLRCVAGECDGEFFHLRKKWASRDQRGCGLPCQVVHKSQNKQDNWKITILLTTFITDSHNVWKKCKWFQFNVDLSRPLLFFSLGRLPGLWLC